MAKKASATKRERDRRDKPARQEGGRDIKEGGIDGARRWARRVIGSPQKTGRARTRSREP